MTTNTRLAATSSATASTWLPRLLTVLGAAVGAAVLFLAGKAGGIDLAVDQRDGKGPVDLALGNFIGSAAGAALLGWALLALLERFARPRPGRSGPPSPPWCSSPPWPCRSASRPPVVRRSSWRSPTWPSASSSSSVCAAMRTRPGADGAADPPVQAVRRSRHWCWNINGV
ncbi:DUF6069 family protein [Streptomyces sp. G1]|nr:DUF6069 family protein [Streptomyces sp. G1]MCM1970587.1 DUF6069 family protein [Streptomyces sp. G1]